MALVKSVLLVDGENLVFRYQDMLAKGAKPRSHVVHIPDVFVWNPNIARNFPIDVFRVVYYTSLVGDPAKMHKTKCEISQNLFNTSLSEADNYYGKTQVVPFIFKKEKKSHKSRLVDIFIAVDAMKYAAIPNMECITFLSGDSDFIKVYDEVMRYGKKVKVGAFSSGCAKELNYSVDEFFLLDDCFFEKEVDSQ